MLATCKNAGDFFVALWKIKLMRIDIEFMVSPNFLEGVNEEIKVCFENVPYVPNENLSLWVKWEDFYDQETAEKKLSWII